MIFTSTNFAIFFALLYPLYLLLRRSSRWQNRLLLVASYIFYGFWDWRFLGLIAISTAVDYYVGLRLDDAPLSDPVNERRRKQLLWLSVAVNLGILGFFKYFNFFSSSFIDLIAGFGLEASDVTLNIVLPVGVSFYTFQSMSYTISIYRGELKATHDALNFALFVAFFPQLVAGPIERASNLLPQIEKPRAISWSQIDSGLFLIIWGVFKKLVIADNLGLIANEVFNDPNVVGIDIVLGTLAFALQIYGDFSGYSDIARGVARLMGFELMVNFRLPYFAVNPSDFWQRWHISLSEWLRDYLYIPLGGNRGGSLNTYRNLFLTMLLGGLWHGAGWNFIIWGAYHGAILIIYRLGEQLPWPRQASLNRVTLPLRMGFMFILTLMGWLIFRASSGEQIFTMLSNLSLATSSASAGFWDAIQFYALPLLLVQIAQQWQRDLLVLTRLPWWLRPVLYAFFIIWTAIFGVRESLEFIYFQF